MRKANRIRARLLVLTASAGGGHVSAARAVAEAAVEAGIEGIVRDTLDFFGPLSKRSYLASYQWTASHAPFIYKATYRASDRDPRGRAHAAMYRIRRAFNHRIAPGLEDWILDTLPDAVVSTHMMGTEVAARLKREGRLHVPLLHVCTDTLPHALQVFDEVDRYAASGPECRDRLLAWGIPEKRIVTTGIPIRPLFGEPSPPSERTDVDFGLVPGRPTILLLAGGTGIGPLADILRTVGALPGRFQIVAVAGRNEPLRRKLEEVARTIPRRVRILGFTDRMPELMRRASFAIGKCGGLSSAELLACGTPLLAYRPIPGQEEANVQILSRTGALLAIQDLPTLRETASALLEHPERLARMSRAARKSSRPGATRALVDEILSISGVKIPRFQAEKNCNSTWGSGLRAGPTRL